MEEDNESSGVGCYYEHPHPLPLPLPPPDICAITGSPPQNGILVAASSMVYSSLVTQQVKRKRGRPRKYGATPTSSSSSSLSCLGIAGQGFTPHVISVYPGEDVGQKISLFMQQTNREICILSASGTVSSASLRQATTSGGSVTYEGRFEILSLKGSYVHSEFGGRTGGISVCLAGEGQIFGGGLGGPLLAAGPVQVILGSFVIDTRKEMGGAMKVDVPANKMASPVGGSASGVFRSPVGSPHENIGGGQFVLQHHEMHMAAPPSMEWRGSSGHGMQQSPENGDYRHMPE